jgi:RimJ/RimL family protein N-acetyltransferase
MVERWTMEMDAVGWGPWAVEVTGGPAFVGMCGLHRVSPTLPSAPAVEVAWRLDPAHWGHGYATEAGAASLRHGFDAGGLPEIVSFTAAVNVRSQAVMGRIGMRRDQSADFDHPSQPPGGRLRRHVLFRARSGDVPGTVVS